MRRCRFTVNYGDQVARFSSYRGAHIFAQLMSISVGGSEIEASDGMCGQYRDGVSTPEFEAHSRSALASSPKIDMSPSPTDVSCPSPHQVAQAIAELRRRGMSVRPDEDIPGLYQVDGRELTTMQLVGIAMAHPKAEGSPRRMAQRWRLR